MRKHIYYYEPLNTGCVCVCTGMCVSVEVSMCMCVAAVGGGVESFITVITVHRDFVQLY